MGVPNRKGPIPGRSSQQKRYQVNVGVGTMKTTISRAEGGRDILGSSASGLPDEQQYEYSSKRRRRSVSSDSDQSDGEGEGAVFEFGGTVN